MPVDARLYRRSHATKYSKDPPYQARATPVDPRLSCRSHALVQNNETRNTELIVVSTHEGRQFIVVWRSVVVVKS